MWYTFILTEKIKSDETVAVICRVLRNKIIEQIVQSYKM